MADTYDNAPLPDRMTLFVPHAAALGMTLVSLERGRGVMRVDWREDLVGDPAPALHEGLTQCPRGV